jgi:hypothetical protein
VNDSKTSYDIRVWTTKKYVGTRVTSYTVRWAVAGRKHRRPFRTAAAADAYRSELLTAARKGEAFDVGSGLPASTVRQERPDVSWYEFACRYVDLRWPSISPAHRKSIAESAGYDHAAHARC